jgi:hypothetical protein
MGRSMPPTMTGASMYIRAWTSPGCPAAHSSAGGAPMSWATRRYLVALGAARAASDRTCSDIARASYPSVPEGLSLSPKPSRSTTRTCRPAPTRSAADREQAGAGDRVAGQRAGRPGPQTAATAHRRACTRLAPAGVPPPRNQVPARPGRPGRGSGGAAVKPGLTRGFSSHPEAGSGPRRGWRGLRGMIGACIAALPVRPDVHGDTGRNRGPEQRGRCQSPGRPGGVASGQILAGQSGFVSRARGGHLPAPLAARPFGAGRLLRRLDFSRPAGQRPEAPGAARRCPQVRAAGPPRRTRAPSPGCHARGQPVDRAPDRLVNPQVRQDRPPVPHHPDPGR